MLGGGRKFQISASSELEGRGGKSYGPPRTNLMYSCSCDVEESGGINSATTDANATKILSKKKKERHKLLSKAILRDQESSR